MNLSYEEQKQRAWMEQRHCLDGTVFEVSVFFNSRTASSLSINYGVRMNGTNGRRHVAEGGMCADMNDEEVLEHPATLASDYIA